MIFKSLKFSVWDTGDPRVPTKRTSYLLTKRIEDGTEEIRWVDDEMAHQSMGAATPEKARAELEGRGWTVHIIDEHAYVRLRTGLGQRA